MGVGAPAARRGSALRPGIKFEQAAKGVETNIQIPRNETCDTCKSNGAAPGTEPTTCPQCRGAGQLRYQQGFFTVARTCSQCRGSGKVIAKPCPDCKGDGTIEQQRKLTVKIPAGIATGQRLRLTGEGEAGTLGGPSGDLYVVIYVREHPVFQRDGNNLHCTVPSAFTPWRSVRRSKCRASTRKSPSRSRGDPARHDVPLARQSMPECRDAGRATSCHRAGVTPKRLTKEQKKLLEQLAATLPDQNPSRRRVRMMTMAAASSVR